MLHQSTRPSTLLLVACIVFWPPIVSTVSAQLKVLHAPLTHLRSGERREWDEFPERASGNKLRVSFQSETNTKPWTLGLRRVDVKEAWQVSLNGKRLGRLFSDENDMQEVWELAPGDVKTGANELLVEATSTSVDDVRIGQVWLDPRPRKQALGEARLQLAAKDHSGEYIPCRFTILNNDGSLAALDASSNDQLAVRSGVVYSSSGKAEIGLPAGKYTIFCGRGFEYSLDRRQISLEAKQESKLAFGLKRVVDTSGLVACDTHVHTFEVSRHGDASLAERMVTLAGEGVELAVATDHNVHVDYRPYLKRYNVEKYVTPIIGNEVTTKYGHFNVFPATANAKPSNHKAATWEELFKSIYATPNVRFAIINHPRDVHSGFTPFDPENMIGAVGSRLDNRELRAGGLELINSAALQSDPMVVFHDWQALLNSGLRITAIGSSDSHEVSRKIVGQGRSYVYVNDEAPGKIDVRQAVDSFVQGRVLVSMGLLAEMTINGQYRSGDLAPITKDEIEVRVRVQGPAWTSAERVELYANGRRIRSLEIPNERRRIAGVKSQVTWRLRKPPHDLQLVAVARGPGNIGLHWPIAKAYQATSTRWQPYVFASTGAVRLDVDNNGRWQSAAEIAKALVDQHADDFPSLLRALSKHDPSIAPFAAQQWKLQGHSLDSPAIANALAAAPDAVRNGIRRFVSSERDSLRAQANKRVAP